MLSVTFHPASHVFYSLRLKSRALRVFVWKAQLKEDKSRSETEDMEILKNYVRHSWNVRVEGMTFAEPMVIGQVGQVPGDGCMIVVRTLGDIHLYLKDIC